MGRIKPPAPVSLPSFRRAAHPPGFRPELCAFVAALLAVSQLVAPHARAAEEREPTALVLNQDSLGQTREQILAAHGIPVETDQTQPNPVPEESATPSDEVAQVDREREEWTDAPDGAMPCQPPSLAANATTCIEVSVRAGNGLEESARVCRAVFPD